MYNCGYLRVKRVEIVTGTFAWQTLNAEDIEVNTAL